MQPLLVNAPEILLMTLLVVLFRLLGRNRSASMRLWVATWCVIWVHFVLLASAALLSQPVLIILTRGTLYFSGILLVVLLTAAVEFRSRWLCALGLFAVPALAYTLAIALRGQNRAFYFACMLVFFAGIAFMAYRAGVAQPKSLRALQVAALEVPFVVWGFYGTWHGHFVSGMFAMLAALFCLCGMLFWYSYRRVTPGVVISCAGFVSWGLVFAVIDFVQRFCPTLTFSPHTWNLPKIVVALGMIVALLEDESQLAKATANRLKRLAQIVETTHEAVLSVTLDGRILSWNRGAERLFGYSAQDIVGRNVQILIPEDRKHEREAEIRPAVESGKGLEGYETFRITKLGERKPISLTISPIWDESGHIVGMSSIVRDLTQVKKAQELEEQLRQAQKLESLGRLTGGVAHDFNNLLMVISSYTEMLEAKLAPGDRLRKNTQQVLKAAARAASLTQQMLAFSRKQVLSPQVLDVNVFVDDIAKMLKRMIGEDVELVFLPGNPLWSVLADPGQMTQVLMNLGVNARDAMPKGGKLTIETRNVIVDAQTASCHAGFLPGRYVMIAVSDTGIGMTKDVQERVFEPFFTTKENGKGTGLGLATVYGIVKQSGGYIWVYSEVGRGSCFKLYFPQSEESSTAAVPLQTSRNEGRGETILLVEDEDSLREAVHDYLRENGYEVLEAANGQEALEVAARHSGGIHLLLTDVIMPKMSGPELARELSSREGMAVLFMSGYTDDAIVNHGVLQPGVAFLQKPFSLDVLGAKVRNVLDSRQTAGQNQGVGKPARPISQVSPMRDQGR